MNAKEKLFEQEPELTDELLQEARTYLDELRESGITNMFGARPYLQEHMGWNRTRSTKVLSYWMQHFGED